MLKTKEVNIDFNLYLSRQLKWTIHKNGSKFIFLFLLVIYVRVIIEFSTSDLLEMGRQHHNSHWLLLYYYVLSATLPTHQLLFSFYYH